MRPAGRGRNGAAAVAAKHEGQGGRRRAARSTLVGMNKPSDSQALAERVVAAMVASDNVSRGLGIHVEEVRPGGVRLRMIVREDMLNAHGLCHGGVLFTLADTAFAFACNNENRSALAVHAAIDFAAAARLGEALIADCGATAGGSRLGVYDSVVTTADGRLVAVFRGTAYRSGHETLAAVGVGEPEAGR